MDYERSYERIARPFRGEAAKRALNALDKGLPYLFALAYACALVYLFATGDARFWWVLIVPAATFALVTAMRMIVNAPRPYEAERIDALVHKDTCGKSFPSRHVACAVIIACALFSISPIAGSVAFAACAAISFTRIVGGVHYPRDVVAAALVVALCGIIGFVIIP